MSQIESCQLKQMTDQTLPFKKGLRAQVSCGVFHFENEKELLLVCRRKDCFT